MTFVAPALPQPSRNGFAAPKNAPKDLLEFPLVKNGIDPVWFTKISPNGNLAQLVEQRTLNP